MHARQETVLPVFGPVKLFDACVVPDDEAFSPVLPRDIQSEDWRGRFRPGITHPQLRCFHAATPGRMPRA